MKTSLAFIFILTLIFPLISCNGGNENEPQPVYTGPAISDELPTDGDWCKATIAEVESVIGDSLPVPAYLPANYQIQEIHYYRTNNKPPSVRILLLISDQDVRWEGSNFTCRLVLQINWGESGLGLKMPWATYISEVGGRLEEEGDEYTLYWGIGSPFPETSVLILRASQRFSLDELITIAASVPMN
jgi:hypothetical protein